MPTLPGMLEMAARSASSSGPCARATAGKDGAANAAARNSARFTAPSFLALRTRSLIVLHADPPKSIRCGKPSRAHGGGEQTDLRGERETGLRLVQQERRRKVVHEGKRKDECQNDADAAGVDADRIPRELLFERHYDPAQRVDAHEPECDGC